MMCPKCGNGALQLVDHEDYELSIDILFECSDCDASFFGRLYEKDILPDD